MKNFKEFLFESVGSENIASEDLTLLKAKDYKSINASKNKYYHTFGKKIKPFKSSNLELNAPQILIGHQGAKAGKIEVFLPDNTRDFFFAGLDGDDANYSKDVAKIEKILSKYDTVQCKSIKQAVETAAAMETKLVADLQKFDSESKIKNGRSLVRFA